MAKPLKPNPLNYSPLAVTPAMAKDMKEVGEGRYRWIKQPFWPQKNIHFEPGDRGNRRALIKALMDKSASHEVNYIGYQLLNCSSLVRCKSPLCNYCRTKLQDTYQKSVLDKFDEIPADNIYFLTLLDDLSQTPLVDVPGRINAQRKILREVFTWHFPKQVSVFGAFEVDAKDPSAYTASSQSIDLLEEYGLSKPHAVNYMPHFHGLVALDGTTDRQFRKAMRSRFTKRKQVTLEPLRKANTKTYNLQKLARYMFKFQYRYAVNLGPASQLGSGQRATYKKRMDDNTLRTYAELIHQIKGSSGTRGLVFKYNI